MNPTRSHRLAPRVTAALLAAAGLAGSPSGSAQTNSVPAEPEPEPRAWKFSASVMGYFVPDSRDYAQPTFTADHDWLHLEARYNYEALETGSAWVGYNFGGGTDVTWSLTPMLGGVFGDTTGVAPGYEGSVGWWKLELYSEGEYVVDTGDPSGDFFYTWSQLTLAPWDWLQVGLVTQRTRAYDADRQIQRGLLLALTWRRWTFTGCLFNPEADAPSLVLGLSAEF